MFSKCVFAHRGSRNTNWAGSCGSSFATGLSYSYFWGLETVKYILKNSDFGLGQIFSLEAQPKKVIF
jgi:hypothetical protein